MRIVGKLKNWLLKAAQEPEDDNAANMEAMAAAVLAAFYAAAAEYNQPTDGGFTLYPIADDDGDADGDGQTLFCVCCGGCDYYVVADGKNAEVVAYYCYAQGQAMYCSEDIERAVPTEVEAEDEREAFRKAIQQAVAAAYGGKKKKPSSAYKVLKADAAQQYTLGVAYPADDVDAHGDFTDATELEAAAWDFMRSVVAKGDAGVGTDHADGTDGAAQVVESYIYRGPDWEVDGEVVAKSGDWLVGAVWTDDGWDRVEKGELVGWSIQGTAMVDPEAEAPADGE